MKKLLIACVAALMVACATETKKVNPADLVGEWTIEQVGDIVVDNSVETLLAFNDSLHLYSAYVGCNRINGTWLHADSMILTDGLSTRMYCEGLMELEQELCETLPQVKKAVELEKGTIALQGATDEILLVIRK